MPSTLQKVAIRHTSIGRRIVIARMGKDPRLALEQRDATSEFYQALVSFAFDGAMPEPGHEAEITFGGGDEQFVLTLRRLPLASEPEAGK